MEKEIRYPRCGKKTRQNKHGKSKAESQRYLCKYCNKTYVTTYSQILYDGLYTSKIKVRLTLLKVSILTCGITSLL